MPETKSTSPQTSQDARARIAANPLWYHTLELAPGVVTPGWFDLRPVVDRLPWPDVRGKRCLDVGTYDGFLAFELERRGAAEVVATDIADHASWDWPAALRARGVEALAAIAGPEKGLGFRIAAELLGSKVQRVEVNAYDLSPERMGEFDVVVCGSLLLHLRDPVGALEAMRSVCRSHLLSVEEVRLAPSLLHPRRPLAELDGASDLCQWWVPNTAGHRRMLEAAGFEVLRSTRPFCESFGPGFPARRRPRERLRAAATRVFAGGVGVPTAAALATPAV
jgi:tRNA (mo5U34)-methyltransferase